MCSLTLSSFIKEQIGQDEALLTKMKRRAFDASIENAGLYDAPNTNLRSGFAADLRQQGVRKERIGDDRVYFTGRHSDCNYTPFYLKRDKKEDDWAQDDNNPNFHTTLRNALAGGMEPPIPDPKVPIEEPKNLWENASWFLKGQTYLLQGTQPDNPPKDDMESEES